MSGTTPLSHSGRSGRLVGMTIAPPGGDGAGAVPIRWGLGLGGAGSGPCFQKQAILGPIAKAQVRPRSHLKLFLNLLSTMIHAQNQ